MPRWKELPSELGERERQLVVQLRRLKDHNGLSLTGLAAKTEYSSSSWERYLNGKLPVPRGAVEQLARACATDPTRLLVLHEVAAHERESGGRGDADAAATGAPAPGARGEPAPPGGAPGGPGARGASDAGTEDPEAPEGRGGARASGGAAGAAEPGGGEGGAAGEDATAGARGAPAPARSPDGSAPAADAAPPGAAEGPGPWPAEGEEDPYAAPARVRRTVPLWAALTGVVAALALAFTAGFLTGGGTDGDSAGSKPPTATPSSPAAGAGDPGSLYGGGHSFTCKSGTEGGVAYAGHSTTDEAILQLNSYGQDVVEAQCLLKRYGFDPGVPDGVYGPATRSAAMKFQRARGLVVDGLVGPDTWKELRAGDR
ncbi:peptidoglycan-binding protein [Streptomyces sp. NPDC050560]|uniref:peptidoglycan-binding protein n=1 Tax=Streptomyces sp. NPDC050560 TaxID=3365630 RepID=UPI003795DCFF